jgi:glycosyltransferase involved in cell wall biosynthesis
MEKTIHTLVVMPAYNEVGLHEVVQKVLQDERITVLVIDDGSTLPLTESKTHTRIYAVTHSVNLGQGAALQTGFEIARKLNPKYVVTMDADGQHDVESLASLISAIEEKQVDIIFGRRNLKEVGKQSSKIRKLILHGGILFNWLYTGIKLSDAHNGYRILNKTAYTSINLNEPEMAHATEILEQVAKLKLSYAECDVVVHYTSYSKEKGQKNSNLFSIVKNLIFRRLA